MKIKYRMSNKRFIITLTPIIAILLVLLIGLTSVMNMFSHTIDEFLGGGYKTYDNVKETAGWNLDYVDGTYSNIKEAQDASYKVAEKIQEEGAVLLKNNGVLPLDKDMEVVPFGRNYLDPTYGQMSNSGSAKWTVTPITPEEGLKTCLTVNNAAAEKMEMAGVPEILQAADNTLSLGEEDSDPSILKEYSSDIYEGIESQVNGKVGIFFIGRDGKEGRDLKYDAYEDGTPHALALTQKEKETLAFMKKNCSSVVVVIMASTTMELAPLLQGDLEADAILYYGQPGEKGLSSLGKILTGEVNPSGRTVDLFATDFTKAPSYQNFGDFYYTNVYGYRHKGFAAPYTWNDDNQYLDGQKGGWNRFFIEYEENIYSGYRYYETADAVDDTFVYGDLDDKGSWIEAGEVTYPFGYGLSYTRFEQKIADYNDEGDEIRITVNVKNTGDVAGKDVVEVYYNPVYTKLDQTMEIEKAVTNLIGFDKTELLQPGESEEIQIAFSKEDMASYAYQHQNSDGTKGCYVLEEGAYVISINKDSHNIIESRTWNNPDTIWYEADLKRESDQVTSTNQFEQLNDYMHRDDMTLLSRADWNATFPSAPEGVSVIETAPLAKTKELEQEWVEVFGIEDTFDPYTDESLGNVEGSLVYDDVMPASAEDNGLSVIDVRGLEYDDPLYDKLLDQIDWKGEKEEIITMLGGDGYTMDGLDSIGLPTTREIDGMNGLKVQKTDEGMNTTATYGYGPLQAQTWNTELVSEMGEAIALEAIANNITSWYAPAFNLHRSPFGGRNFEYFSEDGFLSGKIASAMISGAGSKGMNCYIKHFVANDCETNRTYALCTWATEQTLRELYLKPFEICVKEAEKTVRYIADNKGTMTTTVMPAAVNIMTSQAGLGAVVAHVNYPLLNNVLRDEWGYKGMVQTDMFMMMFHNPYEEFIDLTFRSGVDTFMGTFSSFADYESATTRNVLRNAIHRIVYTVANSNAMQGIASGVKITYHKAPWEIYLFIFNVVGWILVVLMIGSIIWRVKDGKKHPKKYNNYAEYLREIEKLAEK